jgi:CBS domain-containing protein
MNAGDVMTTGAATVRPDSSLADAARLMIEHRISGLPVVDAQGRLAGIITEGDFLRPDQKHKPNLMEVLASGGALAGELNSRRVADLMTADPITIAVDTPVEVIAALMNRRGVKRLPVVTQGKVVGIVSRSNLLLALLRKADAGA